MKKYTLSRISLPLEGRDLRLLILRPGASALPREQTPGILWLHGGGYAVGGAWLVFMSRALDLVRKYGAVVVAPEYRLAGKAPYPAALEDCYEALKYLRAQADCLGCSSERLMVGGESAGGGLTAALCLYARDKGEVSIAYQMPLYPMLDHRDTDSSRDNHGISWNTRRNHAAWKLYLRGIPGEPPSYACPALESDLRGLPPAYTFVGVREPFYCETLAYIQALRDAGVPAHADVYPTGFHAFDMLLPRRRISRRAVQEFERRYQHAAKAFTAPQK